MESLDTFLKLPTEVLSQQLGVRACPCAQSAAHGPGGGALVARWWRVGGAVVARWWRGGGAVVA
eukprot:6327721-Prymnesium_polylepis.1